MSLGRAWFYKLDDITFYLKENLSEVEFVFFPMIIEAEQAFVKCAAFDDIITSRIEIE